MGLDERNAQIHLQAGRESLDHRLCSTPSQIPRTQASLSTLSARSFMPQLPGQLSSAIQPGPATLVNGIQCPLRDKILLCPTVSSKTSTGNIKDGGLEGTPQLFRIPQSTLIPTKSRLGKLKDERVAEEFANRLTSSLG